jgi:hypothetical protein
MAWGESTSPGRNKHQGQPNRFCSVRLRGQAVPLNRGTACADTDDTEGFEGSVSNPTPPSDDIPLERRCAFQEVRSSVVSKRPQRIETRAGSS